MKLPRLLIVSVAACLAGCGSAPVSNSWDAGQTQLLEQIAEAAAKINLDDPQAVAGAINISRDEFKKVTSFEGPNASVDARSKADGDLWSVRLRAWKGAEGTMRYQIYVLDSYVEDRWRSYSQAYDSKGNRLQLRTIDRAAVNCTRTCLFKEHLGIDVTRAYLEQGRQDGLLFKIYGATGARTFAIPAGYVTGFLKVAI